MTSLDPHPSENVDEDFPQELRSKRILLATESFGPINGVSRTTGSLVQYLRDNGVEVAVVAPKFAGSKTTTRRGSDPELRVAGYPLPYNPDLTVAYPMRLDTLYRKAFRPDLIYLASPASVGFQLLLQIRQMLSPPPVILNFQTDLSAYSQIIFPPLMDQYAVWLLKVVQGFLFSSKAVHTIFYPSKMVRDYLAGAGTPMEKTIQLGRGVDTALFTPGRRDEAFRKEIAPNGEIILCCVGRLAPEKGFGFLAQVAQKLDEEDLQYKLVITGGNQNPAVEEEVHRYFKGLEHRVIFTGFRKNEALATVYASSDIFLHCSITETFGLVVLEAMACGIPVVARDQGGPSEIVRHNDSGYLVHPDDLQGFVSRTREIMQSAPLRQQLSHRAREIALNTTWKKINNQVACQIMRAINDAEAAKLNRPIRDFIEQQFHAIVEAIQVNLAIAMTFFMWGVAVVPLLIHGNSAFPNWFRMRLFPNLRPMGDRLSQSLKAIGL